MEANDSSLTVLHDGSDHDTQPSKIISQTIDNKLGLNPQFENSLLEPESILTHIKQLIHKSEPTSHAEILKQLLEQFVRVDYETEAFPYIKELKIQLAELDKELLLRDGSINDDKSLEKQRKQRAAVQKQLSKLKLNYKHLLVLSVENVINVAKRNKWGLCKNHDFIYLYNGEYWKNIDKEVFQKFLGDSAEKMGVEKLSAKYYLFREQLFKQFLATAYLPKPTPRLGVVNINLKNGTFEITPIGFVLRNFKSEDFIKYQLLFEYDPDAKAPIFQAYLDRVIPDKQKQYILSEYMGYVFIQPSTLKLEKTLLLYGTGGNGKSVFFDTMKALLGNANVSSYSLQSLTNENGYYRAMLSDKLVNYTSEMNGNLETAIFKQMVSGEPIEARLPYGDPFMLSQYGKLIFNCNELPKDVEHTNAYFRRFLIVPFDITIPDANQDAQFAQKIISSELSGVFNWVLEGLNRLLMQKHFTDCEAVKKAREQYEQQSDSVKMFIVESGYENSASLYILIKDLYILYRSFCNDDGFKPVSKSNFIKRLLGFKVVVEKRNVGNVAYIQLKATEPY